MFAAAARIGAPLGADFCAISLSDNLKPWPVVQARLRAVATAGFVIALYNPLSQARPWQLGAAFELLREVLPGGTPVVFATAVTTNGRADRRHDAGGGGPGAGGHANAGDDRVGGDAVHRAGGRAAAGLFAAERAGVSGQPGEGGGGGLDGLEAGGQGGAGDHDDLDPEGAGGGEFWLGGGAAGVLGDDHVDGVREEQVAFVRLLEGAAGGDECGAGRQDGRRFDGSDDVADGRR